MKDLKSQKILFHVHSLGFFLVEDHLLCCRQHRRLEMVLTLPFLYNEFIDAYAMHITSVYFNLLFNLVPHFCGHPQKKKFKSLFLSIKENAALIYWQK